MRKMSIAVAIVATAAGVLASCGGADLGSCDMAALGGNAIAGMAAPNSGQLVIEKSCAGGRCHSVNAKGLDRVGAPAGLDFDVVPLDTSMAELARIEHGAARVHDNVDEIWEMVDSGDMPPTNQGRTFSSEDKETLRNWLACKAPVIEAPLAIGGDGGATPKWEDVYPVLSMTCVACHSSAAGKTAGNGFIFGDTGDACGAYRNIVNKPAVTTAGMPQPCAPTGMTIVTPSNPDASLMLQKVEGTQTCGAAMPAGNALGADNAAVKALRAWIAGGAPPPAGCTP